MLVSHRKKFIFTKTVKTAGTSVEAYFEPYCVDDTNWEVLHSRPEHVCSVGIIGYRGKLAKKSGSTWFNHMPAALIKERLGEALWDEYFKFTVIRNPFDKLISGFFMFDLEEANTEPIHPLLKLLGKPPKKQRKPIHRVEGKTPIERFRSWIQHGGHIADSNKYKINGDVCVDYFVRFENLHQDIETVCEKLSIPYNPDRMPKLKSGIRKSEMQIKDFYDPQTEAIVRKNYAWEIERFGYDIPEPT